MGLVNTGTTVEMKVYLTDLGRRRLLEQGFIPSNFSISDDDVNYNADLYITQRVTDLTGDYNDNVYSLSKNVTIKSQIIQK
jgi:hypothetical protein